MCEVIYSNPDRDIVACSLSIRLSVVSCFGKHRAGGLVTRPRGPTDCLKYADCRICSDGKDQRPEDKNVLEGISVNSI
jgi:hypothetical protein